jgi:hypothetical protein
MARAVYSIAVSGSPASNFAHAPNRPSPCQVWIELKCPINEGSTIVELANDHDECHPGSTKRHSVIFTRLGSPPRQPLGFGSFPPAITHPTEADALPVRRHGDGGSEIGV